MSTLTTDPDVQTPPAAPSKLAPSYVYDPGSPAPPEADSEALAILAQARGGLALDELEHARKVLDGELRFRHRSMTTAGDIRLHLPVYRDLVARIRVYAGRQQALARSLKVKAPAVAELPAIPDLVRILGDSHEGQDLRGQLASATAALRIELAQIEQELAGVEAAAADDRRYQQATVQSWRVQEDRGLFALAVQTRAHLARLKHDDQLARTEPRIHEFATDAQRLVSEVSRIHMDAQASPHWAQDQFLVDVASMLSKRRALAARLAALQGDRSKTTAVVAERVGRAVEAAGGPDNVVGSIIAAEVLAKSYPLAIAPWFNTVQTLETELARITTDFDRLALAIGDSLHPPAAASLRARQAQVADQLRAARAELLTRHRQAAAELVTSAMAGDETVRAAIARLTDICPDAFPAGFPAAIAAAEFTAAAAAELADALQSA